MQDQPYPGLLESFEMGSSVPGTFDSVSSVYFFFALLHPSKLRRGHGSGLLLCGLKSDEAELLDFFEDREYERRIVQV